MLGRRISKLIEAAELDPAIIEFEEGDTYTADCMISSQKNAGAPSFTLHRAIVILSEPIKLDITASSQSDARQSHDDDMSTPAPQATAEIALFVLPPGSLGEGLPTMPVTALMSGEGTLSAPSGHCEILHKVSECD